MPSHLPKDADSSPSLRAIVRGDLGAILICAGATMAIELGAYALARSSPSGSRESLLAALAAATMWVALASAPMAAGGKGNWSAALRGAVPADASLVSLAILWPMARSAEGAAYLTPAGIAKVYLVLGTMALCSVAAVCCGKGPSARRAIALAAVLVLSAAVASPFWTSGLIHALNYPSATAFVAWAIHANPFYSVTGAVSERIEFVWHEWRLMYEGVGTFRDYPPPPIQWYSSAAIYGALGAALGLVALLRGRKGEAGNQS